MAAYDLTPQAEAEAEVPEKSWFQSKIIWVNGLTLVAGIIGYLAGHDLIANNTALVAGLVAIQGLVNTGLRFVTYTKIS